MKKLLTIALIMLMTSGLFSDEITRGYIYLSHVQGDYEYLFFETLAEAKVFQKEIVNHLVTQNGMVEVKKKKEQLPFYGNLSIFPDPWNGLGTVWTVETWNPTDDRYVLRSVTWTNQWSSMKDHMVLCIEDRITNAQTDFVFLKPGITPRAIP